MVEVINIMVTSFKRSHACTAALSAPDCVPGHRCTNPCLLWRLLDAHQQVWVCPRVETGRTEPKVSTFYRIIAALGLTVELTPAV